MSTITEEPSTFQLVELEQIQPTEVFRPGGLTPILEAIRREVTSIVPDVSTAKGRKEIASLAHKVARSKTALDDKGKELVADWKEKAKLVDRERKRMRDELDELKAEVRRPLAEWEEAEEVRRAKHKRAIDDIEIMGATTGTAAEIGAAIEKVQAVAVGESWEEFMGDAAAAKERALADLRAAHADAVKREEERAELERLRAEAEERRRAEEIEKARRERKEREERIAREAREQAIREEVERARKEQEARERAEAERQRKADEERQELIQKAKDAERREQEAAQRERERIDREAREKREADEKRARDEKHRQAICDEAGGAIAKRIHDRLPDVASATISGLVIQHIANGDIPHVSIQF